MGIRISKRSFFLFPTRKASGTSAQCQARDGPRRPVLLSPGSCPQLHGGAGNWGGCGGGGRRAGTAWTCPMLGPAGAQHLSLPSPADNRHGRAARHWDRSTRGTDAATPASAFVRGAGSRQRKRGRLPKQPARALHGISVSTRARGGKDDEQGLCRAIPCLRHFVLTTSNPFASPGPGKCSCAAPVLPKAPTDAASTRATARSPGSATAVLAWALVRGKAPGGPCAAMASVPARPGSRGFGWALAPGRLWAPPWPLLPHGRVAALLTFLPPPHSLP